MNKENFLEHQLKISNELYNLSAWTIKKIELLVPLDIIIGMNKDEIINLIVKLKPTSAKMVSNYLYFIGMYNKYTGNKKTYNTILDINRTELFKQCQKVNAIKKFISYSEFKDLIYNIEMYEEFNALYYITLMQCIYEGIYSDDMSVIKNLRASDIHKNIVTLRDDKGNVYDLRISDTLAEQLIELSLINTWQRKNKSGYFEVNIEGLYDDSCFKIEHRGGSNYRYSYFSRLRKISNDYVSYPLRPLYIYISGIMHRIKIEIEQQGFDLRFAFIDNKKFPMTSHIIQKELQRSFYLKSTKSFRQIVNGFIDVFDD